MAYGTEGRTPNPRAQIIGGAACLAISLGVLGYNIFWIKNVLMGPTQVSLQQLADLENPNQLSNQWVEFDFGEFVNTGQGINSVKNGVSTPRSMFLLIQLKDRWLVADVPVGFAGKRIRGYLEVWTVPLRRQSLSSIQSAFPNHPLAPFQIDAEYGQSEEMYYMLAIVAFVLGLGGYLLWMGLTNMPEKKKERRKAEKKREQDEFED